MGSFKLNFDECSLANPGQLGIGGTLTAGYGTLMRAFSKNARVGLPIVTEILALLEDLSSKSKLVTIR